MRSEIPSPVHSDLALVRAAKANDAAAFEELVKRYDRRLLRIAQNITHNLEDAQDAVQEAFLKAFQHLAQFEERSKFSTWLIRIAVNESLAKLRRQPVRAMLSIDNDIQDDEGALPCEIADWRPNPEELYRTSELRQILIKALLALKPALRVVFVLRDVEGFSIEETAEALQLTPSAVKARLWRSRLQLRDRLNKHFRRAAVCPTARQIHTATIPLRGEPSGSSWDLGPLKTQCFTTLTSAT